jgi:hypothetical protein
MTASAEATLRDYYEALRRGEPLYPYFAERADVVKVGVGERLVGYDEVAEGLREQTRTTDEWVVESGECRVAERDDCAWFSDRVRMAWTDVETDRRYDFDARWSGTLVRRRALEGRDTESDDEWLFVGMHVSAPVEG